MRVWGVAPSQGKVVIERKTGSGWKPVTSAKAKASRVFTSVEKLGGGKLRARKDGESSLVYRVRR